MPAPPFEARLTLRGIAPRLCAWLVLAALAVVYALPHGPLADRHVAARLASGAAGLLFSAALLVDVRSLAQRGPVLRIDERGVLWRRWSADVIPWTEVRGVTHMSVRGVHFVGLILEHPERFPSTTLLGRMAKLNRAFFVGHVHLEVQATDRRHEELVAALEAQLAARR